MQGLVCKQGSMRPCCIVYLSELTELTELHPERQLTCKSSEHDVLYRGQFRLPGKIEPNHLE